MYSSAFLPFSGGRRSILLVALLLWPAMTLAHADAPPAASSSAPSSTTPSARTAAPSIADLVLEFQRVEAEARALDPASADAIARLRSLVEQLARANAQLARDLTQLRATLDARAPATPSRTAPPGTRSAARTGSARSQGARLAPGAPASPVGNGEAAGAPLFAKRGLKKFHRSGCVFGERIKAEDRVMFPDAAAAAGVGLEPCKVCRPQ